MDIEEIKKLAKNNNADAQYKLAEAYYKGSHGLKKDIVIAFKWFHKAAKLGHNDSENMVGAMYARGEGVEQNYEKAVEWWFKCADKNNPFAQTSIAIAYELGQGLEQSYKNAFEWYQKAANQEFSQAENNLGSFYAKGLHVKKNSKIAFNWYKKAAEKGHIYAMMNVSTMYENGEGVKKDHNKRIMWLHKAAELGYAKAQNMIGEIYSKNNNEFEAFKWFLKAAEQNLPIAIHNLGICYENSYGVIPNESLAYDMYNKAANLGVKEACCNLAGMYYIGKFVKQDYKKAIYWYSKASETKKLSLPMFWLGWIFYHGQGTKPSYTKAVLWWHRASKLNDIESSDNLKLLCKEKKWLNIYIIIIKAVEWINGDNNEK